MEQGVGVAEMETSSRGFAVERRMTHLTLIQEVIGTEKLRQRRWLKKFTLIFLDKEKMNNWY